LPHWFHAFATGATMALELGLVFLLFLPRRWRIVCFFIVSAWQIPVILTANYTFLNYLVLILGFLLLDDRFCLRILPEGWRAKLVLRPSSPAAGDNVAESDPGSALVPGKKKPHPLSALKLALTSVMLLWIFYVTSVQLL